MGRNARKFLVGVVELGYTILMLPLIIASAIFEIMDEGLNRPLQSMLDNWVDSAPDNKDD